MKTTLKKMAVMLGCLIAMACGGSDENDNPVPGNGELVLEANTGKMTTSKYDEVTFKVTYQGKDVTAGASIKEEKGEFVKGGRFSSAKAGKYVFTASYKGILSDPVSIDVEQEILFQKNLLMQQFTSVECKNCPMMVQNINYIITQYPERIHVIALHGDLNTIGIDPMSVSVYLDPLGKAFGVTGFPATMLDQRIFWSVNEAVAVMDVEECLAEPGIVGIAIETQLSERNLGIKVKIKSTEKFEHPCRVAVAVIQNKVKYRQLNGNFWDEEYIHNRVLRLYKTDVWGDVQEQGAIERGKEWVGTYTYDIPDNSILPEVDKRKPEDMEVIVYVTNAENNHVYNCRAVKFGENGNYQYVQ